ncbi:hypothetical protein HYPSUDRAFT_79830 [Hypholoma sublateritium FD-334 SS-4]|uniref:Uncharacterized protein n=1 Tax=Hypholoma sublateritium (strain FD-334 SS-4) TaxID=945553 RepID=A0A0D2P985_HYPSF|nr:hypothetical protein HYPSUDRAFT_79830 [Hypholoma sublateritium FD-334 SS-4]
MASVAQSADWTDTWAAAIVAPPCTVESISSRLKDLLDGKDVGDATGRAKNEPKAKDLLEVFVQQVNWTFKPEAFDVIWHAIFSLAKKLGCTEKIRDATYFWTEKYLFHEAMDAIPAEGDEDVDFGLVDGYDNTWIIVALGDARLYSLGYGYSAFAWNALLNGLGLDEGEPEPISDSMRIGSCAQLLGAGGRLKLRIYGGGDQHKTPGFAGRYLVAAPTGEQEKYKRDGEIMWNKVLSALEEQQKKAGPRAAALLLKTHKHLQSGARDLTSAEVTEIVWHSEVVSESRDTMQTSSLPGEAERATQIMKTL